jgi:hypothetical protein
VDRRELEETVRRLGGAVVVAAVAVCGVVVAMPRDVEAMGPDDGTLNVRLVRDVNGNGAYDPALESGVAGITVAVTDPAGGTATATTGPDGTVTADLAGVTGGAYRVEAALPESMAHLKPAPSGGGLASLTEFVDVGGGANVDLTMGVWDPTGYCQANPDLVTCVLARATTSRPWVPRPSAASWAPPRPAAPSRS